VAELCERDRNRVNFFKLSLDMLCISTPEGKFIDLNPAWEQVLGHSREALYSRPFLDFVHPDDRERTTQEFGKLLSAADYTTVQFENRYICKDGTVKDLLWMAQQDPDRKLVYAIARDVTELNRARAELERFAFHAAHDLQEPLRKIAAFGDRLEKSVPDLEAKPKQYLERMLDASKRMSKLIADLLEYARVSKEPAFDEIDLNAVVAELREDMELAISTAGAEVRVEELPTVRGDWTRMRQLFQNLIGNAIKFRKPDVPLVVVVRGKQFENAVEITVQDNGIGFEEKYKAKIFQVFQRLHGRDEYDGTGIGLAVCARIVERHGGFLDARGVLGEGSVFVVTLPGAKKVESDA